MVIVNHKFKRHIRIIQGASINIKKYKDKYFECFDSDEL